MKASIAFLLATVVLAVQGSSTLDARAPRNRGGNNNGGNANNGGNSTANNGGGNTAANNGGGNNGSTDPQTSLSTF